MFASCAANGGTQMTNEPNGPYKLIRDIGIAGPGIGPKFLGEKEVLPALNAAWLAGRASRDGLRDALELFKPLIEEDRFGMISDEYRKVIEAFDKALAEDEKEGR